ncbi:unnamed protein product [Paramecium pentaurelia]|uniref:MAM domain-containing protein n=1 Tax=Paramecium pentaurelia TaxID=43138 RepID=A0A8S1YGN7_9CILI|nr:unnamed protein product [Paramecium pentaurelia]
MLFQIILLGFEVVLGQYLYTPTFFNFNEHISTFITSKNESDPQSTHNCLIVPCTAFGRQQNCMVITKLTFGGDCFTRPIKSNLNFTSEEDVATLEFAYFASRHPSSKRLNTGIVIGWTNDDDEFYWIAAEDISVITSGVNQTNKYAQFVTINSLAENTWTKVRVHIRPNSTKPFRIIFEAYSDATDFAGKFLVTNVSIFDRGICSEGCSSCLSYSECTSCEKGRLYRGTCVSDFCYYDAGSITANKISVGWISEQNGLYGIVLKNIKINQCHMVKFIMNKVNNNYIDGSNSGLDIYQYGFKIQQSSLNSAGCQYSLNLPISGKPGYSCLFEFLLLLKNTTVDLLNITWTQEFYYPTNNSEILVTGDISANQVDFQVLSSSIYLGEASTKVEGKVLLCQSSSCRSFYEEPQVLYLNDPFFILVMLDNKYLDFGADFKFQLVSAVALGNGTNIKLKPQDESEKNMTATIYTFTVPFAVQNCTISITAQLVEREIDDNYVTDNRRRLLLRRLLQTTNETTTTANSGFTVSGSIKVESIEILPYWKVYPKDAPYIIIGVSAGLVLSAIILYCACLTFSQKTHMPLKESNYTINKLNLISDQKEQERIKAMFGNNNLPTN